MLKYFLVAGLLLVSSASAEAQKNGRKGIPRGNTCISATKTCRVGAPSRRPSVSATAPAQQGEAHASKGAWVGSSRGSTNYQAGCSGARKLLTHNLIYFRSEKEARQAATDDRRRRAADADTKLTCFGSHQRATKRLRVKGRT